MVAQRSPVMRHSGYRTGWEQLSGSWEWALTQKSRPWRPWRLRGLGTLLRSRHDHVRGGLTAADARQGGLSHPVHLRRLPMRTDAKRRDDTE
jgi:hypothetical protein